MPFDIVFSSEPAQDVLERQRSSRLLVDCDDFAVEDGVMRRRFKEHLCDIGYGIGDLLELSGVNPALIAFFVELESCAVVFVFGGKHTLFFEHCGNCSLTGKHHLDRSEYIYLYISERTYTLSGKHCHLAEIVGCLKCVLDGGGGHIECFCNGVADIALADTDSQFAENQPCNVARLYRLCVCEYLL